MFLQSVLSLSLSIYIYIYIYIYHIYTKTFGMVLDVAIFLRQMFLWAIMEEELISVLLPEI